MRKHKSAHDAATTGSEYEFLTEAMGFIVSGAAAYAKGQTLGWILGLILGPEEDPVKDALAEMNAKLDRIENLIAGLYDELERAKEQIIREIRRKNWDRLIAELKPYLVYIDEKYQTLRDLAESDISETTRRDARRLVDDILSHNAGGVRPTMRIINDLLLDAGHGTGFLHTWEEIVHDAAYDWAKVEGPKLLQGMDFDPEAIARFQSHMRSVYADQTMNLFAWISGVQLKGLVLLMEASHAQEALGLTADLNAAPDTLINRYRGYIRESGDLFTDVIESIVAHFPLVSAVNYIIDDDNARQTLEAADDLVSGALGLGRIVVHLRCDLEHYQHAQAREADRYLHNSEKLALRLTDGRNEIEATNGRTGIIHSCPAKPFIDGKLPIGFRFYRRYIFENIEPGYYRLVDINPEAPKLPAKGTTLEWSHGDLLLHPDFFRWGQRIYFGGPGSGSLHLVAYQNNANERTGMMTFFEEKFPVGKGLVVETMDSLEWLMQLDRKRTGGGGLE